MSIQAITSTNIPDNPESYPSQVSTNESVGYSTKGVPTTIYYLISVLSPDANNNTLILETFEAAIAAGLKQLSGNFDFTEEQKQRLVIYNQYADGSFDFKVSDGNESLFNNIESITIINNNGTQLINKGDESFSVGVLGDKDYAYIALLIHSLAIEMYISMAKELREKQEKLKRERDMKQEETKENIKHINLQDDIKNDIIKKNAIEKVFAAARSILISS